MRRSSGTPTSSWTTDRRGATVIYQHRRIIARGGRLEKRNEVFQREMLAALDEHGSLLLGAWEVWIGDEAGSAVWQLRQFDDLASWESHQARVREDRAHAGRQRQLYPNLDAVDTALLNLAERSPALPRDWPPIDRAQEMPRGIYEQRVIHLRPGAVADHHDLYADQVLPALARHGSRLVGWFDTLIGPGSMNAGSHRCVELRRFDDLGAWQRWRQAQDDDAELRALIRTRWAGMVDHIDSVLMRPLAYSRLR